MEETIQKLLETEIKEDQLIAFELLKSHPDFNLNFIPEQSSVNDGEYLLNSTGTSGYIPYNGFYILFGLCSFRKCKNLKFIRGMGVKYNKIKKL